MAQQPSILVASVAWQAATQQPSSVPTHANFGLEGAQQYANPQSASMVADLEVEA